MEQKTKKSTSILSKIEGYIQASRIEGGIVASIFFIIGEWYYLNSFPYIETLLAVVSIFLIVNSGSWFNYIYDKDLDKFADKDIDFFKVISPKEMFFTSVLISFAGLIILLYMSILSFLLGLITFLVFLTYAAPPCRFKTMPPLDIICNALGFGFLPFLVGFTILKDPLDLDIIMKGFIVSLPIISYYLFISIFDIDSDKRYGIKNSCTLLGSKGTKIVGVFIFLIGCIASLFLFPIISVIPISLVFSAPLILAIFFVKEINFLRILISILFLFWTGLVLFLMFIFSLSLIPLIFFFLIIILAIMTIYTYVNFKNIEK